MADSESNINFDIAEIKTKTQDFETKFYALTTLDPGNKVGIDRNDNLYAEFFTQPYIMAVVRKITQQKREDINAYLIANFEEYEQFLLFIINAYESSDDESKGNISNIMIDHKMLCVGLVSGLTNLRASYPDYEPLRATCTTYIDKFNLFRGKSNNITLPFNVTKPLSLP